MASVNNDNKNKNFGLNTSDPRFTELVKDIESYHFEQNWEYKGYQCEAIRRNHLRYPYWCGYVTLKTEEEVATAKDQMLNAALALDPDSSAVTEATYSDSNLTIGFDCSHYNDYPYSTQTTAVFRSFPFVKAVLHYTIDNL